MKRCPHWRALALAAATVAALGSGASSVPVHADQTLAAEGTHLGPVQHSFYGRRAAAGPARSPAASVSSPNALFVGASIAAGLYATNTSLTFEADAVREWGGLNESWAASTVAAPGAKLADALGWTYPTAQNLVVIHLATNDFVAATPLTTFGDEYAQLLAQLRSGSPDARFACLGPWHALSARNSAGLTAKDYADVVRTKCASAGGVYEDLSQIFVTPGTRGPKGQVTPFGTSDAYHPNDRGHYLIMYGLMQALGYTQQHATWQSLGGVSSSAPALSSWPGNISTFVLGRSGETWARYTTGGSWYPWQYLGGSAQSDPAAVSWGPGRIDVFYRGRDSAIWQRTFQGRWGPVHNLGGCTLAGPGAASWGGGRLDLFVEGCDHQLWHNWFGGGRWNRWESLGGVLSSSPAAVSTSAGLVEVFVRGSDDQLWHRGWTGSYWTAWTSLGGHLASAPAAASPDPSRIEVFADTGCDISRRTDVNGYWYMWISEGGCATSSPAAVGVGGQVELQMRGTDNAIWRATV